MERSERQFIPLRIAVLTVTDTRTEETDTSGQFLRDALQGAGHTCHSKQLCKDDVYKLRALVATLIADDTVHAILLTGGTGFTKRDNTVVAVTPLFDSSIDGFGGLSNSTAVFCVPGSTGACRTAWNGIIAQQLDSRHRPCNFVDRLLQKGQP